MTEQLQTDFDKITKSSNISQKDIEFKRKIFEKIYRKRFSKQKTGKLEIFRY